MGKLATIARRTFLIGSAAVVGGVAFGVYKVKQAPPNPLLDDLPQGATALTPYVRIDGQGVTLITPRGGLGAGAAYRLFAPTYDASLLLRETVARRPDPRRHTTEFSECCPPRARLTSTDCAPCRRPRCTPTSRAAFEPTVLEQWATQAGVPMPRPRDRLLQFEGLADFLHFLDWACGLASTRERLAELSYGFSQRLADSGAGYADVIVNPTHWTAWHGRLPAMIDAIDAGFAAAEQDGLPPVGLCVSLLRTQSSDAAAELVDVLVGLRHPRVVALSIDGNEAAAGRTGPRFAQAFKRAGAAGLRRTVHAGESSGPEGVRDAIELLGADRIDHGVRAIEDPDLVGLLADRRIPLGICPTSNLTLGVYAAIEDHPIDRLRRAGVVVSINTDDPVLLGASLEGEYALCSKAFGWSDDVLRDLARNSIAASFANADIKARLIQALARW